MNESTPTMNELLELLREHGIQPTSQRLDIARAVLHSAHHPTADGVWEQVRDLTPTTSRATVYNTLNLFVEKGLLRTQLLREGLTVYDPNLLEHHHFIDEVSGEILDLPPNAVQVTLKDSLDEFDVHSIQVVVRGRKRR